LSRSPDPIKKIDLVINQLTAADNQMIATDNKVNGDPESKLELRQRLNRVEIDRIWTDSAEHVRHAVPVDDDDDEDDNEPGSCWGYGWQQRHWKTLITKESCKDYWTRILPCQQWLFHYSLKTFWNDLGAGVTVAVMAVPLSMSYAKLAGLPAYYGLYATFTPPFVYAIFGTSRQLAVGPAALVSLVLSSGLTPIVQGEGFSTDSTEYVARYTTLAIQSSLLAGIILITMGIFRLGFVTHFLSHALISGFTSGASVIIAVSQIKYIFGYNFPSSDRIHELIASLVQNIAQFNWKTFVMGSLSILVLVSIKHVSEKFPKVKRIKPIGPLLVVAVAIVLTSTLNLDERGIPIVDPIPKGPPSVTVNLWTPLSMKLWVGTSESVSRVTAMP
jgi:sulfate transporter 4